MHDPINMRLNGSFNPGWYFVSWLSFQQRITTLEMGDSSDGTASCFSTFCYWIKNMIAKKKTHTVFYCSCYKYVVLGWLRRYSNSLHVGQSGFSTPVWRDFLDPSTPTLETHLAYCIIGTESLSPVVKRPGRGTDNPPSSSVEYLHPPLCLFGMLQGSFTCSEL